MRNIKKDFTAIPLSLQAQAASLMNITRATAASLRYDDDDVKTALSDLYHKKCAYCEAASELEIEHYRPTNRVELMDLDTNQPQNTTGYYWLKIEWSNLLYSCHDCNKQGHKGNRFPISNKANRALVPIFNNVGLILNHHITNLDNIEQPLLINPEVINPYYHLRIDKFGKLIEVNNSPKGKETIEICKLNRYTLKIRRETIINNFIDRIYKQLKRRFQPINPLTKEQLKEQLFDIFKDIAKQGNELMEFTMISYSFIQYFDDMVLDNFEPEFQPIIYEAFLDFVESFL